MASNFKGYFLKNGTVVLDNTIIAKGGYRCTPRIRTDKNSYIDGNGALHRTILPIKRSKISIETVPSLTFDEKLKLQAMFPSRDSTILQYWNDESNNYETATFYVPDIDYTIEQIEDGEPLYNAISIELISYGGDA